MEHPREVIPARSGTGWTPSREKQLEIMGVTQQGKEAAKNHA
jgi:hypothetical protein